MHPTIAASLSWKTYFGHELLRRAFMNHRIENVAPTVEFEELNVKKKLTPCLK